jgi:alpha-glucosidase
LHYSIQGILQFQLFQIPMVGADACGFQRNTTEELCNRWMQLAAFTPFMRNHNINDTISQEPFVWPSVAEASRVAIRERYRLLPYWVSRDLRPYSYLAAYPFVVLALCQRISSWYPTCSTTLL